MSTAYFAYEDDADTKYGCPMSDAQQAIYPDAVGTLPTGYATLELFLAGVPNSQQLPAGLALRKVQITDPFFGPADLMVLTQAQYDAIYPTGQTPFPLAPFNHAATPQITGATGEARNSN